ncbi:MAG: long-chain fatty acid--CoA ligase [Gammaproteobacteria bacterium]|nr:long-chain fatty acid--CoA ligase [Gammaproteobacteria bacterium]
MTMQTTPLLLSRLLGRGALLAPEEEIVTRTSAGLHRQTYAETAARAAQIAHALDAMGIQRGERVATFMWNNARHLELYQAVPSMGAVLHTLNIRLGPADLEYIINHAQDRVIIVDADLLPHLEAIRDKLPCVERFIVCADAGETGGWETTLTPAIDYEDFIATQPTTIEWPTFDENAPLGLCYTSGTTGNPKGVMYTHRSTYLHTITEAMTDTMSLAATDCVCGIVPMFHAMGWGLPFAATMLGAKQVMPHRFMDPAGLLEVIANEQVTISAGVPTIWQGVRALVEAQPDRYDLSSLNRLVCGGSAPPLPMMRWYWDELKVEMIQGWGMTETNPLGTVSRKVAKRSHLRLSEDEQFANISKAGLPMPGVELAVVDESFNPVPHDGKAIGELLIRGPWICAEYYNDPQPDKFHEDWLVTGDIAAIDEENYLVISDRSKDLVKSGGEWISSVDLENHIVSFPGVAQAAVVAQPHPRWDERPVAIVVPAAEANVEADAIVAHCAKSFAKWQLPDEVLFWDAIPLTSTGKLDKKTVRAQLADQGYKLPDLRG